ncbi:MAG: AzlD domain-containing protein [Kineosporiaceae bacterium]
MSPTWTAVLLASAAVFGIKLAGHLAPRGLLDRPVVARAFALTTVALLASLVAVQTLAGGEGGRHVVLDARVAGLAVAAVAVARRAPFLLVVLLAAAVTAGVRLLVPGS